MWGPAPAPRHVAAAHLTQESLPALAVMPLRLGWMSPPAPCSRLCTRPRRLPRCPRPQGADGITKEVPLQALSFARSSTPITVRGGSQMYVSVRVDPSCPSDAGSIAERTTWAGAIHLAGNGISRTLYTDASWKVNAREGAVYEPAHLWPILLVEDGVPGDAVWLTHPPSTTFTRSTWSRFAYVFPTTVCDGLPTAAEVAAADLRPGLPLAAAGA